MSSWLENAVESISYLGILLLMFLENVLPPIPSELIMPAAGASIARGQLNFLGVVLAGTVGALLGQLPLYYLGYFVGDERLQVWANRHGRWLGVSAKDVQRADAWFDRYGHLAVLICRVIPGLRSLISIPAGIWGMPLWKFLTYSAVGTILWTTTLTGLGYWLGKNFPKVQQYVQPISLAVIGILMLWVIWAVVRRRRQRHRRATG